MCSASTEARLELKHASAPDSVLSREAALEIRDHNERGADVCTVDGGGLFGTGWPLGDPQGLAVISQDDGK